MSFAEFQNLNTMTVIRYEDGVARKEKMRLCDGHGSYRSPFDGLLVIEELWLCQECADRYRKQLARETASVSE